VAANLLWRVVSELEAENKDGIRYASLSPIPRFRRAHFRDSTAKRDVVEYLKVRRCGVCRFHLQNGAVLLDVLLNADGSSLRASQSYGAMAMYNTLRAILSETSRNILQRTSLSLWF